MTKPYRRKKYYFVDSFQGKYIFSYFILAGLVTVLFTLLFVYFSTDTLSITYENNNLRFGKTTDIMLNSILSIHGILIIICGFSILYFLTRFTHKTVGPLFKIGRTIETMTQGDFSKRIYLRKNDECKELADRVNHLNDVMFKKLKEIETLSLELDQVLGGRPYPDFQAGSEITPEKRDSIHGLNEKIRSSLSFFNLSGDLPED